MPSTALGSNPRAAHFITHERMDTAVHCASFGVVFIADTDSWNSRCGSMFLVMTASILCHWESKSSLMPSCGFAGARSVASAASFIFPIYFTSVGLKPP